MRIPTRKIGDAYSSSTFPTENELEKRAYINIISGVIKVPKLQINLSSLYQKYGKHGIFEKRDANQFGYDVRLYEIMVQFFLFYKFNFTGLFMRILPFTLTLLFGCFSTAVMSYISMATPIGPWIAPTIVLAALLFLKLISYKKQSQALAYIVAGGSIGGIVATACGFSYPTLYFLDPELYQCWLGHPIYFASVLSSLAFIGGAFGILGANLFEKSLIVEQKLSFPIGQLVYKMIAAGNQLKKAIELMIGFIGTAFFCMFQDGLKFIPALIPRTIPILYHTKISIFSIPTLSFDLWPMLWAIGFVTGHVIAIPLGVGALLKLALVNPVHTVWFTQLSAIEFILAFCSGMVLYGAMMSFSSLPQLLKGGITWIQANKFFFKKQKIQSSNDIIHFASWVVTIGCGSVFFWYFQFSLVSMIFLYLAAFACMYQVAFIAGKFGLAPLGRFATFVMVPAMLLFRLNIPQIVIVATFVEISCGVTADVLFSRKMGHLMQLDRRIICFYQIVGLIVSSLTVGVVFLLLTSHFQHGSAELLAYKSQSRQLLINVRQFNVYVLILGAICSFFLKFFKVNPMLVLGGLLMPFNISIGLIFGGFLTKLVKNREDWEPFWSGVFASNSIWMLMQAIIR